MELSNNAKIIRDPVYGSIQLPRFAPDLIETPEFQRLRYLKQMGLAYLAYPSATHTRFEHSLGVMHLASKFAKQLSLNAHEVAHLQVAALLHDIGHAPFSHVVEPILNNFPELSLENRTSKIIEGKPLFVGKSKYIIDDTSVIYDVLIRYGLDVEYILKILFEPSKNISLLFSILNGTIDADKMDYLLRDSYHIGSPMGIIDYNGILNYIRRWRNEIVFDVEGINLIESQLIMLSLLNNNIYSNVYVRAANSMLSKILIETFFNNKVNPAEIAMLDDSTLLSLLFDFGGVQRELSSKLKLADFYRPAWSAFYSELENEVREFLITLSTDIKQKIEFENLIASEVNINPEYITIDLPSITPFIELSTKIHDKNKIFELKEESPLSRLLLEEYNRNTKVIAFSHERYTDIIRQFLTQYFSSGG